MYTVVYLNAMAILPNKSQKNQDHKTNFYIKKTYSAVSLKIWHPVHLHQILIPIVQQRKHIQYERLKNKMLEKERNSKELPH